MSQGRPIDVDSTLQQLIGDLRARCRARLAVLISSERSWQALAETPDVADLDSLLQALRQLFAASVEVAGRLGGQPVSVLLRQSQRGHIHVAAVGAALLAVAFDDYGFAGLVRHEADRAAEAAARVLALPGPAVPTEKEAAYAPDLIDRIFAAK